MNCNTTHYRANSSSVPGDPTYTINQTQDWDAALEMFSTAGLHLKDSGAEALVLCANTAHVIAERLEKRVELPLIHIVDATANAIRAQGIERVALLGTKFTMELPFFRDRLAWHGVTSVSPNADERAYIHETIHAELAKNVITEKTRHGYLRIIDRMVKDEGVGGGILGCTEIPLLIKQSDTRVPVFDTTALHAAAAVEFMLSS